MFHFEATGLYPLLLLPTPTAVLRNNISPPHITCLLPAPGECGVICVCGVTAVSVFCDDDDDGTAVVVETSANYMGGNSELLVGEGVDRWRASDNGGEEKSLAVVSKFGYASVSVRQLVLHTW